MAVDRQKARQRRSRANTDSNAKPPLGAVGIPWPHVLNSILSFAVGISPTISDKFFFIGLNIEQLRGPVQTLVLPAEVGRQVVSYGFTLKAVNSTKEAMLIERIDGDSVDIDGTRFNFKSALVVSEGERVPERVEAFRPRFGAAEAQLPIILKPQSQQILSTTFFFEIEGSGKSDQALVDALDMYMQNHVLRGEVGINGKLRDYPLKTRPWFT